MNAYPTTVRPPPDARTRNLEVYKNRAAHVSEALVLGFPTPQDIVIGSVARRSQARASPTMWGKSRVRTSAW